MNRRIFSLSLAAGALGATLPALAQQSSRQYRIGLFLSLREEDLEEIFVESLRRAGFVQGRNLEIKWMYSSASEQISAQARELIAFRPDALISEGFERTRSLQVLTSSIPIVFVAGDPVASGLVQSLAHPGGNTTGISTQGCVLLTKQLQLLSELVPSARRLHVVLESGSLYPCRETFEAVGSSIRFVAIEPGNDGPAIALQALMLDDSQGVVLLSSRMREFEAEASMKGIPIVSNGLRTGVVMALYAHPPEMVRREAELVARILRGAKPSEFPVELVSHFRLEVDIREAKRAGIRVPASILLRADRVVE